MKKVIVLLVVAMFFIAVSCEKPDASKDLKPLVDQYVEAWNTGNEELFDAVVDPQFERHMSPASRTIVVGLDSLKSVMRSLRASYPDFHVTMDEVIYLDNKVITRYHFSGTNTGPGAIPPTGKKYTATGISISNVKDGKFIDEFAEVDNLIIMLQLGFTLTPPQ